MIDNFEKKKVYENRTYERQRFSFSLNGKEFKGNFHDNRIQWLHPHPKQDVEASHLEWIEGEIYRLLGEDEGLGEVDNVEVKPFLDDQSHEAHQFKFKIANEEFKGLIRNGKLEWFHPKPRRKINDETVKKVEKKVHEKVKKQKDDK